MAGIWEDIRSKSFLPISRRNYLLVGMRSWGYKAQGMCLYKQFPSENKLSLIQQNNLSSPYWYHPRGASGT
jgi:hypothetical protein